jgi:hypothetical protein
MILAKSSTRFSGVAAHLGHLYLKFPTSAEFLV